MRLVTGYVLTALVSFAIDPVWLGRVAREVYSRFRGHLLADDVSWLAAPGVAGVRWRTPAWQKRRRDRAVAPAARAALVVAGLAACGSGGLGRAAGAGEGAVAETPEGGGAAGDSTVVVTLGTGTPYPDPGRSGPATAVAVGDRVFLFDAGAGVMRQLNAAGLPISGPEATFITHLHSDHTLGYPDLVLTSWIMRRTAPLPVYGPPGLAEMTGHLMAAWEEDIRIRIDGLERELPDVYRARVTEVGPGVVYDSAGVTVTAFRVDHGSWEHAYGFRLDAPDRSVVIAGDARPSATVVEAARGADVLVHEAYPEGRVAPEDRPGGELWPQYMEAFHTSGRELGEIAAAARPGLLVLTHVVWMGGTEAELLDGIRAGGWAGPVAVAEDLGRY